jgi:hypothetical protein
VVIIEIKILAITIKKNIRHVKNVDFFNSNKKEAITEDTNNEITGSKIKVYIPNKKLQFFTKNALEEIIIKEKNKIKILIKNGARKLFLNFLLYIIIRKPETSDIGTVKANEKSYPSKLKTGTKQKKIDNPIIIIEEIIKEKLRRNLKISCIV